MMGSQRLYKRRKIRKHAHAHICTHTHTHTHMQEAITKCSLLTLGHSYKLK
jgi:hypothetical protein